MTHFVIIGPALGYVRRGRRVILDYPGPYLKITLMFSLFAATAALVENAYRHHPLWLSIGLFLLDSNAAVVAPVVTMMAVAAGCHGHLVHIPQVIKGSLPWVPRYIWTNVHTTAIFWIPTLTLLALRSLQEAHFPVAEPLRHPVVLLWWALVGSVALYLHSRTLLAPYLAVHSNLAGTVATLEALRLSGQHFALVFVTLILCLAPVVVPLGITRLVVTATLYDNQAAIEALNLTLPHLFWVWIQIIRLALVPPVHLLYQDLWAGEVSRRAEEEEPEMPSWVQLILNNTSWVPTLTPTQEHEPGQRPSTSRRPDALTG